MCIFSKYKDMFGKPNEGVHSHRIYDYAIVDILMTLIGGYFIAKYYNLNIIYGFIILFLIGQICHILFCVDTKFLSIFK